MTPEQLHTGFAPEARVLALRYRGRADTDDLIQVALTATWAAALRYDPDRGSGFRTYATRCVLGELRRYLRDTTWRLHVPRSTRDLWLEVGEALPRLAQHLGRQPTVDELAADLGRPVCDVDRALAAGVSRTTLPIDPDLDDQPDPATGTRDEIASAIAALPPRERRVASWVLVDDLRQADIAARLGVSQVTVSRWWLSARTMLRDALADAA